MERDVMTKTLYQQVAADLISRINRGEFPKGSMIISEAQVQKEYNVSRVTVRKAYKSLIEKGILRTIQGKGTFVNDIDTQDWTWMRSFTSQVSATGHNPTTRIIEFKTIFADIQLAERLGIKEGAACYFLKRVRYIDNKPVWLTKSYIPCSIAPDLSGDYFSVSGKAQSIFQILDLNYGVKAVSGDEIQEAINITEKDAQYLNIEISRPVISKAFIAYDSNGNRIVYENTIFEQSISKFHSSKLSDGD